MRFSGFMRVLLITIVVITVCTGCAGSQAPAGGDAQAPANSAASSAPQVHGTLAQVMQGILFPASNVIFAAQDEDPASVKPAADPSTAVNPLASAYGGWRAVENSALTLAESANLLIIPGRVCSNGRPVPIGNEDWKPFVQGLRDAGMTAYKAAQSKNQDSILEAADAVSVACSNCHDKYREKPGGVADRCM